MSMWTTQELLRVKNVSIKANANADEVLSEWASTPRLRSLKSLFFRNLILGELSDVDVIAGAAWRQLASAGLWQVSFFCRLTACFAPHPPTQKKERKRKKKKEREKKREPITSVGNRFLERKGKYSLQSPAQRSGEGARSSFAHNVKQN